MRILLLEDDAEAAERVLNALNTAGLGEVTWTRRGQDALELAGGEPFDVLVLDRMVEGLDGLAALARLRDMDVTTPAVVLSNLGNTRHRVEGLDAGADDYLAKPFEGEELVARIRALARRAGRLAHPDVLVVGELEVRLKARTVHWRGDYVDLSPKEFEILALLAESRDVIVSRQRLWDVVWPEYRIPPQVNVIDVNLSRLRAKLEGAGAPGFDTVRGQGFVLRSTAHAAG